VAVPALSKRIHAAIVRSRLSQAEVARRAGVRRSYVAALATDGIRKPDPVKMGRVADVLGLDIRELLAITDQLGSAEAVPSTADHAAVVAAIDRLAVVVQAQTAALLAREGERDAWLRGLIAGLVEQARGQGNDPTHKRRGVGAQ